MAVIMLLVVVVVAIELMKLVALKGRQLLLGIEVGRRWWLQWRLHHLLLVRRQRRVWHHVLLLLLIVASSVVTGRTDHVRVGRRLRRIEAVDVLLVETKILRLFVDQVSRRRYRRKLGRVALLLVGRRGHHWQR